MIKFRVQQKKKKKPHNYYFIASAITSCSADLWVDVQYAGATGVYHLVYRVDFGAVQIPIVLSMLEVAAGFNIHLHLCSGHKAVRLTVLLFLAGPPRRD